MKGAWRLGAACFHAGSVVGDMYHTTSCLAAVWECAWCALCGVGTAYKSNYILICRHQTWLLDGPLKACPFRWRSRLRCPLSTLKSRTRYVCADTPWFARVTPGLSLQSLPPGYGTSCTQAQGCGQRRNSYSLHPRIRAHAAACTGERQGQRTAP